MIDPFKTDLEQSKLVLKRFALARAAIVLIVAFASGAIHIGNGASLDMSTAYLFVIFLVALIESFLVAAILTTEYCPTMRFSFLLLCADLTIISAIVLLTGGSGSVFAFLYIAAILSASILLSFNGSLLIATICSGFIVLVAFLQLNDYILSASAFRLRTSPMSPGELWADTLMKIFAFYLTAFLAGYLSRRIGLLQSFQRNILNSFSSGFISIDRDRIVTFLNAAGSDLLQRSRSESVGKYVSSVLPIAEERTDLLEEAVTGQEEWLGKEITVVRGDGKKIPVGITVSPLRDSNKRHLGSIATFIDLTKLKRMEEMLRRSDRLAAVGEVSASLAHEIRNPLASIRCAIQEISENISFEGTNTQLKDIMIKESDHLSKIVSNFLDFVGNGQCKREQFDVGQFLEEVEQAAKRCFARNGHIRIFRNDKDNLGTIIGDRGQLKQALLNLVQNGMEAMPHGGELFIEAFENGRSSDHVNFLIHDQGQGLPHGAVEEIFNPFYTTKKDGTGLGMAIVHRIVTSHGGTIDIETEEGKGTTVIIGLPRET